MKKTCCMIMSLPRHFNWKRFQTDIENLLNFDFKVGALMQVGYPGGTRLSKPIQPKELYRKRSGLNFYVGIFCKNLFTLSCQTYGIPFSWNCL